MCRRQKQKSRVNGHRALSDIMVATSTVPKTDREVVCTSLKEVTEDETLLPCFDKRYKSLFEADLSSSTQYVSETVTHGLWNI
jgi:hypothetical protein